MKLKVIGTGSQGNCYILKPEQGTPLIIECGTQFNKVKEYLNFNLNGVEAIVSHVHGDHFKYASQFLQSGVNVYALKETFEAVGLENHHRAKYIEANKAFNIGEFKILPFEVKHDVPTLGFLINHKESGNILFLTDTMYSPYKFKDLNNILIEANYCPEIAKNKLSEMEFLRNRVLQSHMSINTCIDLLKENDLSKVNNIVLIHLSDTNSNEVEFVNRVKKATHKTTYAASNGMEIMLNKTPF